MNLKICLIFIALIFSTAAYSDIIVNEVMHSPLESDDYNEWIELYNNGTEDIDLLRYKICNKPLDTGFIDRNGSVFRNNSSILKPDNYAIITDNVTEVYEHIDVPNETLSLHVKWVSICSGLTAVETINISNENSSVIFAYNKTTNDGYSIEYVDGEYIESSNIYGTFGKKNNATQKNDTKDENFEYDIFLNVSKNNYSLNEQLNITGFALTNGSNTSVNITIKIGRKINDSYSYKWNVIDEKEFFIKSKTSLENLSEEIRNYTIPKDFIKGEYKIHASLKYADNSSGYGYRYKYSDAYFYVNGLDDLGEYQMIIMKSPEAMRFGDIENVFLRLDSNNYNLKNVSIVTYIYSPRWASIDLNDDTLMSKVYDSNTAVKMDEIKRGTINYFSIPLLSKRNCENDYNSGTYIGKVRIYENDEYVLEENFNITLSGRNEDMCKETIIETKNSKTTCKTDAINSEKIEKEKDKNAFTYDDIKFLVNADEKISEKFKIEIDVENSNETKEFLITYYAASSRTKISDVKKETITLKANEKKKIKLNGDIQRFDLINDTKIFVKLNSTNRKTEKSVSIPVTIEKKLEKSKIIEFYATKKKNSSDKLYAEAKLKCDKDDKVVFESLFSSKEAPCKENMRFETEFVEGKNPIFLTIIKENEIIDAKKIFFEDKEAFGILMEENILMKNDEYKGTKESSKNLLTGKAIDNRVLYESKNEKLKKLINYLMPLTLIIGVIAYYWSKKNG